MRIEISTRFETSYTEHYSTKITAKILDDNGIILCEGEDRDQALGQRASAKKATKDALQKFEHLLKNARDVAEKSGLL